MTTPSAIYRPSLALLTDLYELTMAYAYWKSNTHVKEAVFHLFFRHNPFHGGFTIACGLGYALGFLEAFRFEDDDLRYLAGLRGADGTPLFEPAFLDFLRGMKFDCDVDAVPEGTVVFPQEPLLRVTGPIWQAQLIESALLNAINFQTLIATKAARVCMAAEGQPVIEFGLRRSQGFDGSLAASRAAFIGGCAATSNVLAGRLFGIPVRGTHAHSWVMSFDSEAEAFDAYARACPNNCLLLVDTYDTLAGVHKAVEVGKRLRRDGHELLGIRLDSGDLAYLSIEARRILDENGFPGAVIVASNDLDENVISSLKDQGADIDAWGVGTKLATAHDQPALGGVYKLTAVRQPDHDWSYRIKLSEQAVKITTPGILQVRRYHQNGRFLADAIYDVGCRTSEVGCKKTQQASPPTADLPHPTFDVRHPTSDFDNWTVIDPIDMTRRKRIATGTPYTDLLVPVMRGGKSVGALSTIEGAQIRVREQLAALHPGIKRFINPHEYPVGLEMGLHDLKTRLILQARGENLP